MLGDTMNTELLLWILIILVIFLIIISLWLIIRSYQPQNQAAFGSLKAQLDDQYQNDRTLMLKTQETATTLLSLQQQFQTLSQEFHVLNKGSFHNSTVIDEISQNLNEMQKIMVNKKARGNWGEYQLETLLALYIGENKNMMERQYSLQNGYIADVALHVPDAQQVLIIDAKFPMENYQNIIDAKTPRSLQERYVQLFKSNIKKHIHDIAKKYINIETLDLAVMFIPSEAVYTYICSDCPELIDEAYQKHVLMASPTTLAGIVFTLLNVLRQFQRTEHMKEIEEEIYALLEDTDRLLERTRKASQAANQMTKQLEEVQISAQKLAKRMACIKEGEPEQHH